MEKTNKKIEKNKSLVKKVKDTVTEIYNFGKKNLFTLFMIPLSSCSSEGLPNENIHGKNGNSAIFASYVGGKDAVGKNTLILSSDEYMAIMGLHTNPENNIDIERKNLFFDTGTMNFIYFEEKISVENLMSDGKIDIEKFKIRFNERKQKNTNTDNAPEKNLKQDTLKRFRESIDKISFDNDFRVNKEIGISDRSIQYIISAIKMLPKKGNVIVYDKATGLTFIVDAKTITAKSASHGFASKTGLTKEPVKKEDGSYSGQTPHGIFTLEGGYDNYKDGPISYPHAYVLQNLKGEKQRFKIHTIPTDKQNYFQDSKQVTNPSRTFGCIRISDKFSGILQSLVSVGDGIIIIPTSKEELKNGTGDDYFGFDD